MRNRGYNITDADFLQMLEIFCGTCLNQTLDQTSLDRRIMTKMGFKTMTSSASVMFLWLHPNYESWYKGREGYIHICLMALDRVKFTPKIGKTPAYMQLCRLAQAKSTHIQGSLHIRGLDESSVLIEMEELKKQTEKYLVSFLKTVEEMRTYACLNTTIYRNICESRVIRLQD